MNTDDIVQFCAEDVLAGRKTPAACAAAFPKIGGLEANLTAAMALRRAQALAPRPEAQQRIEARLRERAWALHQTRQAAARRGRQMPAGMRWATGAAMVATVLAAGAGTAAASTQSLPGELLYGVKRADESARVFFSPISARAFVYAGLAEERLDEMTVLSQRGGLTTDILTALADDLVTETATALAFVGDTPADRQADILQTLVRITDEQQAVLAAVKARAPAEAQAGLARALQASSQGHEQALERLEQAGAPQATRTPTPGNASPTATATPPKPKRTETAAEQTHVPPGQTKVAPGQTKVPPGRTNVPPGQTRIPSGQTNVPPGQTNVPPETTHGPRG